MNQYHIDRIVSQVYNISVATLRMKSQRQTVILPRMTAMLLCHELLGHNWNRLKRNYGKLSHDTTRHAVLTARDLIETNRLFRDNYNLALARIKSQLPALRSDQQRYDLNYRLRSKQLQVNTRNRSVSITASNEQQITQNKRMMRMLSKHRYSIQYAIV